MKNISEFYGKEKKACIYKEEGTYVVELTHNDKVVFSTFTSLNRAEDICEDFVDD